MNEFTKEELKSLQWAIEQVRERTNNRGDAMRGLLTKIQSLIDNYHGDHRDNCNHDGYLLCRNCGMGWVEGSKP